MIFNYGNDTETFNVTIYANQTIIGQTYNIELTSRNSTIFSFTWNTTGFAYGNYTISAYAWPVPGETDTADNNFTGSAVTVTIPGDINGDGTVDIYDAITLAGAYNSKLGDPNWNVAADINSDNTVDIYDAILLANNFGNTA